mgnify:FL=1
MGCSSCRNRKLYRLVLLTKNILSVILYKEYIGGANMELVNKDMNIMEAVEKYPVIAQVLMRYGLGCVGCIISSAETLGEGIAAHGLNPDIIIEEVNAILEKQGE